MPYRTLNKRLIVCAIGLVVLLGVGAVTAQTANTIALGENKVGQLAQADQAIIFALTIDAPLTVVVQTLSVTTDLALRFDVVAPSGVIVGAAPNVEASTIASARISLPTTGSYFIRIESANGRTGDFLLSVQGTSEAAAAQALTLGQTVNAQVDSSSVRRDYNFQGAAEPLVIDL